MTQVMAVWDLLRHVSLEMTAPRPVTSPSLLPREKGAWGQVLFPMATGLVLAHGHAAAIAFAAAAIAAFFAHEPMLVLFGGRGDRTRRGAARRAFAWTAVCGLIGIAAFATGVLLAEKSAHAWLLAPVVLSLGSLAALASGRERTTPGEILAASAMSSWIVPMAVAASVRSATAVHTWMAYVVAFTAATLAVRGVLEAFRNQGRSRLRQVARVVSPALLTASVVAWLAGQWPVWIPVALAPTLVLSLVLSIRELHPRQLRTVGWSLIASTAFLAVVLAASSA